MHHCVTAVRGNYEGSGLYIVGSSRGERGLPSLDYLLLQIWTLLFSLFQGRKPHMSLMLNNEHMRMGICHHCWLSLMIGSNWIGIKNHNLENIRLKIQIKHVLFLQIHAVYSLTMVVAQNRADNTEGSAKKDVSICNRDPIHFLSTLLGSCAMYSQLN